MPRGYELIKRLDHYLGLPICMALSALYGLIRLVRKPRPRKEYPNRVLIIKFFGLGSIGYSTVIVRDLKKRDPTVRVTLLTFEENRTFVEFQGVYDRMIGIDKRDPVKFIFGTIITLLRHLAAPYDVCIDLEYFSKYTTIHTAFTRARQRIGFWMPWFWRKYIYTEQSYFNTAKHIRRIYGMVAELTGVASSDESPAPLRIPEDAVATVAGKLRDAGWDGKVPLIGINVNASDLALGRRWPIERFAALVEAVAKNGGFVGLTGAPQERDYVEECIRLVKPELRSKVVNLAGQLSLIEFLALLKTTEIFVTNDSGPMIFSVLSDAPSVSIWGPGDPRMYGGKSPRHTYLYSQYPCSPCMYVPLTGIGHFCHYRFPCMEKIRKEHVIEEVLRRLRTVSTDL